MSDEPRPAPPPSDVVSPPPIERPRDRVRWLMQVEMASLEAHYVAAGGLLPMQERKMQAWTDLLRFLDWYDAKEAEQRLRDVAQRSRGRR